MSLPRPPTWCPWHPTPARQPITREPVSPPPSPSNWTPPWTPASSPSAKAAPGTPSPISPGGSPSRRPIACSATAGGATTSWARSPRGSITTRDAETGAVEHATAYTATVRLHVPGVPPRTDVGFRVVAEESAQGHETAYKGAVTDALKRALRTLGAQFGNDLGGNGGTGATDTWAASLRQTLLALGAQQGFEASAGPRGRAPAAGAGPGRRARRQVAARWSTAAARKLAAGQYTRT